MRRRDNGVVITVYVESSTIPSRYNGGGPTTHPRKRKPSGSCSASKATKYGYDRRAQLLAHARRLRRAGYHHLEASNTKKTTSNNSKPKPKAKKWRWKLSSAKFRRSFRRIFRKKERGYDRIETDSINHNKRNRNTSTWRDSHFFRSLIRMVKGCYGHDKNAS